MKKFNVNNFVIDDVFDKIKKQLKKKNKKKDKKGSVDVVKPKVSVTEIDGPIVVEIDL